MNKEKLINKLKELPDFEVVIPDQECRDLYFNFKIGLEIDFESGHEVIVLYPTDEPEE
jgi:hypothetical protein